MDTKLETILCCTRAQAILNGRDHALEDYTIAKMSGSSIPQTAG
jgi:hypothetical protein